MHILRFYIAEAAKVTYARHQMGVGVFNMQGFERRNKESKNIYKRFSNHKGKGVMKTLLGRLWDVFAFNKNAY